MSGHQRWPGWLGISMLAATACHTPLRLHPQHPAPLGPTQVEVLFTSPSLPITDQRQSRVVNGKPFEVHLDGNGDEWLRDPQPPHQAMRADSLPPPGSGKADTIAALNQRLTSRPIHWDFAHTSESDAMRLTGLDRITPQLGLRQSCAGAALPHYDNQTLLTHVVYPMRTDVGVPDLAAHPALRYDVQLLGNFMSVAIEGQLRDVARYLAAQGIRVIRRMKVVHHGVVHEVDTHIDAPSRTVAFFIGTTLLRVVPF